MKRPTPNPMVFHQGQPIPDDWTKLQGPAYQSPQPAAPQQPLIPYGADPGLQLLYNLILQGLGPAPGR